MRPDLQQGRGAIVLLRRVKEEVRMNKAKPTSRWRAYTWGLLAVLTCPCHLPILALLLSGTAAGAFLSEHIWLTALALVVLFILAATRAVRAFRRLQ